LCVFIFLGTGFVLFQVSLVSWFLICLVDPSLSLNLTLSRNEKIEQHIRKKTHKLNVLRFWVEGGVIPLYGLALVSFL